MRVLLAVSMCLLIAGMAVNAQQVLYEEHFTGGVTQLTWHPGWGEGTDSMRAELMAGNPSGDGFVGREGNTLSGGSVGMTIAGDSLLTDYILTAWVYVPVTPGTTTGPYNSLVFRAQPQVDTLINAEYYQYDTDFDDNHRLRFRKKDAPYPTVIHDFPANEIPGGAPTQTGWQKMSVKMVGNQFWLYWNDQLLPGCPYTDNFRSSGYFGAYIFYNSVDTSITVDDVVVTSTGEGVAPVISILPTNPGLLTVFPNPFNPSTTLSFSLDHPAVVNLQVFDTQGRPVATLVNGSVLQPGLHNLPWNAGNLPAGVYLTRLNAGDMSASQRVVLVK